jgi:ketosteroid isomerase-like protein
MSDTEIKQAMREFVAALTSGDADKALSYCTESASWITPEGTFQGVEAVRRYVSWMGTTVTNVRFEDSGIGILVQGDQAFYEHTFSGTYEGETVQWAAVCAYEFSDGKIQRMRIAYDRLTILQQAAKGWLEETVVSSLVKRAEKGLH